MTIRAELVEYKKDIQGYITYVFRDLDTEEYVMCTKVPNWDGITLHKGEQGFLKYKEVIAGVDSWYDKTSNKYIPYKFTNSYYEDFVPLKTNRKITINYE